MEKSAKLLAISSLALFFIAGILAGIIIDRKVLAPAQPAGPVGQLRQGAPQQIAHPGPRDGQFKQDFLFKLKNDLQLTSAQEKKVSTLLDENEKEFDKIREGIRDKFSSLDYKLFKKISAVLDEKQKQQLISSWIPSPQNQPGAAGGPPPAGQPMPGGPRQMNGVPGPGPEGMPQQGGRPGAEGRPGMPVNGEGGQMRRPPAEAVEACRGKAEGAQCGFTGLQQQQIRGVCRNIGDAVACVPPTR